MLHKKKIIIVLVFLLVFSIPNSNYVFADSVSSHSLILIPVRNTFEELGYLVTWNASNRTICLTDRNNKDNIVLNENDNMSNEIYSFIILNNKAFCSISMLTQVGYKYKCNSDDTITINKIMDIGSNASDFILNNLDGEIRSLKDFKSNKTLLIFWTSWCPYCVQQLEVINDLITNGITDNINIVTINLDKELSLDELTDYVNNNYYQFEVLLGKDNPISREYNITSIPTIFIIDEQGIILEKIEGDVKEKELQRILEVSLRA